MTVSPRDEDVIQEAFGQRVRDALDALETAAHFGDEPGPTYRAGVAALDALLARVHALERAASALLEVIDGGPARYDASEHSAACNDLAEALRAVVLEGAAPPVRFRSQVKDSST